MDLSNMTISDPTTLTSDLSSKHLEASSTNTTGNPDDIDYTPAFRRESHRRQQLDEFFKLNNLEHFNQPTILNSELTIKQPAITFDDPVFQKNAYFDVLPSFEMYHSLQYHTPSDVKGVSPPDYSPSLISADSSADQLLNNNESGLFTSVTTAPSSSLLSIPSSSFAPQVSASTELYDKNIVDNYHRLPQFDQQGLNISINITKNLPGPHTTNENESILKEYSSGDIVHGYVVIENKSGKDVPFKGFYVTLEGVTTVVDTTRKAMINKKFLIMVDLSATWTPSAISSSAVNQDYVYGTVDAVDGCFIGLPDERIIKPGLKYKKFFTFKLPYNVLDDKCRHEQNLHLLLPPSLGFNKLYKNGKYADIEIDPILKYGYRSFPGGGGPVIVEDLTRNLISISYSINALFVDDESPRCNGKLSVIKHGEHFLRFIPFGFGESLFSSKRILSNFKSVIEMNLRSCENFLEGDVKTKESISRHTSSLYSSSTNINHSSNSHAVPIQFPIRNENGIPTEITRHITYQSKPSSKFSFGKSFSSEPCHGALTITTGVPKDGIPYVAPKLIHKVNKIDNMNNKGIENFNNLLDILKTNEKRVIDELTLDLNFESSLNGSSDGILNLPKLKNVAVDLLALNIYSNNSIPMKLSSDIFLNQDDTRDLLSGFKSQFKPYMKQYQEYQSKFEQLGMKIDSHFDKNIHRDLLAIEEIKCDSFVISNLFQTDKDFNANQTNWKSIKPNEFTKQIKVKFDLNQEKVKEALVPTFQSCLITRAYFIQVSLTFKDGVKTDIKIPIRVRNFNEYN